MMARNAVTKAVESAATTTAKGVGSRVAPYMLAPAGALCAFPAGELLHVYLGPTPWGTVGMTALTMGLSGAAWHFSSAANTKKAKLDRVSATLATVVSGGWLTAATIEGLIAPVDKAGVLSALAVVGLATLRRATRNTGSGADEHSDKSLFSRVKLAGARATKVEEAPNRVTAVVQLGDEHTADDLVEARPAIAARLGVSQNSVRALPDPDNHSRGTLIITPRDLLRTSPKWPGPLHVGGTMIDPIHVGLYEDGEPILVFLTGDPRVKRPTTHIGIFGMSGAGKGVLARNILAGMAVRRESTLWICDTAKPGQNVGAAAPMCDWFATNPKQAKAMFRSLKTVIPARANWLGERGMDAWMPGCGLTHLTVEVEEAADVAALLEDLTSPMATARSVGVEFVISTQRPTHDVMPTTLRSNIGTFFSFGVRDEKEAAIALPSEVLEAGARPDAWKATKPGYLYMAGAPWVVADRYSVPGRTFYAPFGDELHGAKALSQWVLTNLHYRDPIDEITAEAAGKGWLERESFNGSGAGTLAEVRQRALQVKAEASRPSGRSSIQVQVPAGLPTSAPAAVLAAAAVAVPQNSDMDVTEADDLADELVEDMPDEMRDEVMRLLAEAIEAAEAEAGEPVDDPAPLTGEDRQRAAQILAEQPGPDEDDEDRDPLALLSGHPEMTREAARAQLLEVLYAQEERSPGFTFRAKDIAGVVEQVGRGSSWGRTILSELTDEQVLERVEVGLYKLAERVPALAGQ